MTKGGVIIGRTVSILSPRLKRNPERDTTSAKASPSAVVVAPTVIARNSEFHAAPQRVPTRQPRPQSRSSKNFVAKTVREYAPSSVMNAAKNVRPMGKKTKAVTMTITPPMALTTKTSPLTAPPCRDSLRKLKEKRRGEKERAVAHSELPVTEVAEQCGEPLVVESAYSDAEALRDQPRETEAAGQDQND